MNDSTKLVKLKDEPGEIDRRMDEGSPNRSPGYGYGDPAPEAETHLLDYWRAVRKRLWLVIGVAALITTLDTLYVASKPDVYAASSLVKDVTEIHPMYENMESDFSYLYVPAYLKMQLQIKTSPD